MRECLTSLWQLHGVVLVADLGHDVAVGALVSGGGGREDLPVDAVAGADALAAANHQGEGEDLGLFLKG